MNKKQKKLFILITTLVAFFILLTGCFLFLNGDPLSFLKQYGGRTFSFTERILAQPRVVIFHLSQIFLPLPSRFAIAHDIALSSSIFQPWTTIPSIIIILSLLTIGYLKIKQLPFLSLAIFFFFLNHIIESSVIALEIIFEHRNYLPSFFLFIPAAQLYFFIANKLKKKKIAYYYISVFCTILLISFCALSTHIRNKIWKNDITLWTDVISKAPNNARALNIIAIELAWGTSSKNPNRFDMALKLFEQSLTKNFSSSHMKADILGNMAIIFFHVKKDYKKGLELFEQALDITPRYPKIRHDFVKALIKINKFDDALEQVNILIKTDKKNGIYQNLKGKILIYLKKYDDAILCFKKAYKLNTFNESLVYNTSMAFCLSGKFEKAEELLKQSIQNSPQTTLFYFAIIENYLRSGDDKNALFYKNKMDSLFSAQKIKTDFKFYSKNPQYVPISKEIISPIFKNMF
jgi:tetratricopeptide (TPR) repeat protein